MSEITYLKGGRVRKGTVIFIPYLGLKKQTNKHQKKNYIQLYLTIFIYLTDIDFQVSIKHSASAGSWVEQTQSSPDGHIIIGKIRF